MPRKIHYPTSEITRIADFYDDKNGAVKLLEKYFSNRFIPSGFFDHELELFYRRHDYAERTKTRVKSPLMILETNIETALGMGIKSTSKPGIRTNHSSLEKRDDDVTLWGR